MATSKRVATNRGAALAGPGSRLTGWRCPAGLLLSGIAALAQAPQAPVPPPARLAAATPSPAGAPGVTYADGQLRIDLADTTLADVLTKVSAVIGVNIEVPPGAKSEKMTLVQLGPGSPREILTALLGDSGFDYLIQASDADSPKLLSVMVLSRDKKGGGTELADADGRQSRSPFSRAVTPSEPAAAPGATPADQTAAITTADAAPAATDLEPPTPHLGSPLLKAMQPDSVRNMATGEGQGTPPANLTPTTINSQLQQMYQQRQQMIQQTLPQAAGAK